MNTLIMLFLLLGLCVGSFLTVVIYRLPICLLQQKSNLSLWLPSSHCDYCFQPLTRISLLPFINFLILRGKSRCCNYTIPIRYPLIELATGITFLMLFLEYGLTLALFANLILASCLIALFFIDLDTFLLPHQITLPLILSGLIFNYNSVFCTFHAALLGAFIGYFFPAILAWLYLIFRKREGMGQGDFKLIAALGAWFGWQQLPLLLLFASLCAIVLAISLLLQKKMTLKTPLPFGPFLAMAGFLLIFYLQPP